MRLLVGVDADRDPFFCDDRAQLSLDGAHCLEAPVDVADLSLLQDLLVHDEARAADLQGGVNLGVGIRLACLSGLHEDLPQRGPDGLAARVGHEVTGLGESIRLFVDELADLLGGQPGGADPRHEEERGCEGGEDGDRDDSDHGPDPMEQGAPDPAPRPALPSWRFGAGGEPGSSTATDRTRGPLWYRSAPPPPP